MKSCQHRAVLVNRSVHPLTMDEPMGIDPGAAAGRAAQAEQTSLLVEEAPILRRLRPLVKHAAGKGMHVYHMGVGCLKLPPPRSVVDGIRNTRLQLEPYPQSNGQDALLEAVSKYLTGVLGFDVSRHHSMIVPGGLGAVFGAISLCSQIGDQIGVVRPSWPNTPLLAKFYGRKVVEIETRAETGWQLPTLGELAELISDDVRLLVIERPANPTGVCWTDEELTTLDQLLERRPALRIFADEEYMELCVGEPRSILELRRDRILAGSGFSKSMALTSARLGRLTTLDPEISRLFVPRSNVWLGANNLLGVQGQIAEFLLEKGSGGAARYFAEVNDFIAKARCQVRVAFHGHPHIQLHQGAGAYYDILRFVDERLDAEQVLIHRLLTSLEAMDAQMPGPARGLPFTYVMPLRGFYSEGVRAEIMDGFRLTLALSSEELFGALSNLSEMIEAYIDAGAPYYGTVESVVDRYV